MRKSFFLPRSFLSNSARLTVDNFHLSPRRNPANTTPIFFSRNGYIICLFICLRRTTVVSAERSLDLGQRERQAHPCFRNISILYLPLVYLSFSFCRFTVFQTSLRVFAIMKKKKKKRKTEHLRSPSAVINGAAVLSGLSADLLFLPLSYFFLFFSEFQGRLEGGENVKAVVVAVYVNH